VTMCLDQLGDGQPRFKQTVVKTEIETPKTTFSPSVGGLQTP